MAQRFMPLGDLGIDRHTGYAMGDAYSEPCTLLDLSEELLKVKMERTQGPKTFQEVTL